METIRFSNVTFSYPLAEAPALQGVDFSARPSEFIVVCGKSGCGKTTLLRHMKKNLVPYGKFEGSVTYDGEDIQSLDDRRSASEIGFVQQDPDNQIVTDKVWHEMAFGLESLGVDPQTIRRRVAEMASFFDIQTWFRKDVSQLSGGQKQMLNLASIMVMQPKLLILDEPTSQLDPIAAGDFFRTIHRINRELGITVIISEHRLEDVFAMADKVCVMDQGKVLVCDAPERIGEFLSGKGEDDRHPMFYGLPSVTKIFHGAGAKGKAPLTVREGRLWLEETVQAAKEPMQQAAKEPMQQVAKEKPAGAPEGLTADRSEGVDQSAGAPEAPAETPSGEPVIRAKDLWFRYDKKSRDVLRDLQLEVRKGEWMAVLGGNGVGKSTLLKVICGMIKPQRGSFTEDGRIVMLPQNPKALFTEIEVEDELLEVLRSSGLSDEEKVRRVTEMMELLGIGHLRKSHPYDLSGGEEQRLALGKVLLLDPDILLLDEPTKGLDPFFKVTLAKILRSLCEQGQTILMVSHDIEFCAEYVDRCAMFFDGGITSIAGAKEFFRGNHFYTTTANRIARDHFPDAITWEEVAACVRPLI